MNEAHTDLTNLTKAHALSLVCAIRLKTLGEAEKRFAIAEADLKWGLAYIFYCMMQTSTIYDRLRRDTQEEEAPKRTRMSALCFLHMLPRSFTTAEAIRIGAECGIGEGGVAKKLVRLTKDYYIAKVRHGVFVKVTKAERNRRKGGCTVLAA